MIKIAIIDDNLSLLEDLQSELEKTDSIEVVFTAPNGVTCLNYLSSFKTEALPEVILMDISMPKMNGIETTEQISTLFPAIQVIMLTTSEEDEQIIASIQAGAKGYLLKTESSENIKTAIKEVRTGGTQITPSVARKIFSLMRGQKAIEEKSKEKEEKLEKNEANLLTAKELEILELLADGLSYKLIADKLFISINTIKTHIYHIYEKLGVTNKTQAINKIKL
jgi:DNA-binding NarL/FixJ family response regulator